MLSITDSRESSCLFSLFLIMLFTHNFASSHSHWSIVSHFYSLIQSHFQKVFQIMQFALFFHFIPCMCLQRMLSMIICSSILQFTVSVHWWKSAARLHHVIPGISLLFHVYSLHLFGILMVSIQGTYPCFKWFVIHQFCVDSKDAICFIVE